MREIPKPFEVYRHFKGNLYQILAIATDSEDGSKKVVYQALYEPFGIYVRDLDMFLGPVDHEKYPDIRQGNRFELITGKRVAVSMQAAETSAKIQTTQLNTDRQEQKTDSEPDSEADSELDPKLLEFLDAKTYEEKLRILTSLHGRITQDMINTMAVSLDIEVASGEIEERYEQVKNCLITFEKYECNRLR